MLDNTELEIFFELFEKNFLNEDSRLVLLDFFFIDEPENIS